MKRVLAEKEMNEVLFEALRAVYRFEQEKVAEFGLDYGAIYLLQYLRRNAQAPLSQAAADMRLPISTASRLAGRLEEQGLIRRIQDTTDRRRILLSLKTRGHDVVRKVERHSFKRLTANLKGVNGNSVVALVSAARLLPAVLGVADEKPAE
jgi:DNA-binding MarR family transcriptional regulator